MTRLDSYLAYAESHRILVCGVAGLLIAAIGWADFLLPDFSVGFLYLIPLLVSAPALKSSQISALALVCGYLREAFDPLQGGIGNTWVPVPVVFNPLHWVPGSLSR